VTERRAWGRPTDGAPGSQQPGNWRGHAQNWEAFFATGNPCRRRSRELASFTGASLDVALSNGTRTSADGLPAGLDPAISAPLRAAARPGVRPIRAGVECVPATARPSPTRRTSPNSQPNTGSGETLGKHTPPRGRCSSWVGAFLATTAWFSMTLKRIAKSACPRMKRSNNRTDRRRIRAATPQPRARMRPRLPRKRHDFPSGTGLTSRATAQPLPVWRISRGRRAP